MMTEARAGANKTSEKNGPMADSVSAFRSCRRTAWEPDTGEDDTTKGCLCCLSPWLKSVWNRISTRSTTEMGQGSGFHESTYDTMPPSPSRKAKPHHPPPKISLRNKRRIVPQDPLKQNPLQEEMALLSITSNESDESRNLCNDKPGHASHHHALDPPVTRDLTELPSVIGPDVQSTSHMCGDTKPDPSSSEAAPMMPLVDNAVTHEVIDGNDSMRHLSQKEPSIGHEDIKDEVSSMINNAVDEYQYEEDFEVFSDENVWESAFNTAVTKDEEVWSVASEDEVDVDPDTLNNLLTSVTLNDTTTHLKCIIDFYKSTMSKAETALFKWLKVSRMPFPSSYTGQQKSEAIEYLGDDVRYYAEDFCNDVTKTFMEHPLKLLEEIEILREKQKTFIRKFKRNQKYPRRSNTKLPEM